MLSGNCTHFRKKNIKRITEYGGFRGNYHNIDVLEIFMYEFVDGDEPLDDNEPMHKAR